MLPAALCLIGLSAEADAQITKGEKSLGPKVGYVSKNKTAVAGLVFQYAFNNHFRIAPELGYIFRHNNLDAFEVDINGHVPFNFTGDKVAFYPLAGLHYSSWSHHLQREEIIDDDDVTTRTSRFGLNLGAASDKHGVDNAGVKGHGHCGPRG